AGTGAVGIEALSRGAKNVYFVESSPSAVRLIRQNLASLGIADGFELLEGEVIRHLRRLDTQVTPDFIFLDPPYMMSNAYESTLRYLGASRLTGAPALVIAEHQKKFELAEQIEELRRTRRLVQGDAVLSFYRRDGGQSR